MTAPDPTVSVIIPTHNRAASVARTLRALAAQKSPGISVDVVVVADGCTDGTSGVVEAGDWPMPVRLLVQPALGPAAARNRGAAASTGDVLIFLDDDIEASSEFVAAHADAHRADGEPALVAIGYLPTDLQDRGDFFAIMLRAWWEAMFGRMREPGHRFAYSDLLSGNFSIGRPLFNEVGGFDEGLRCHEDYELGLRLIEAGARFEFVEAAVGLHHEHTDLRRALRRKRDEGSADVRLARKHPSIAPALPFSAAHRHLTLRGRALKKLALRSPVLGDAAEACCRTLLPLLEGCRLRTRWRTMLDDLLAYWYWRGVGEALEGAAVSTIRRMPPAPQSPYQLDLRPGLEHAIRQLDADRPEAVTLRWGPWVIGTIPVQPGAERLAGRHLEPVIRGPLADALAETMAVAALLGEGSPSRMPEAERHRIQRAEYHP